MRRFILSAASSLGLEAREEAFGPARLMTADGVFLTNSLRLLMRPGSLDGHSLADRASGIIDRMEAMLRQTIWPDTHTRA